MGYAGGQGLTKETAIVNYLLELREILIKHTTWLSEHLTCKALQLYHFFFFLTKILFILVSFGYFIICLECGDDEFRSHGLVRTFCQTH